MKSCSPVGQSMFSAITGTFDPLSTTRIVSYFNQLCAYNTAVCFWRRHCLFSGASPQVWLISCYMHTFLFEITTKDTQGTASKMYFEKSKSLDFRFSQRWWWEFKPPVMWCCVIRWAILDVLKDYGASIFRINQSTGFGYENLTGQGLGLPQIICHAEVLIPHWTDLIQCSLKLKHLLI